MANFILGLILGIITGALITAIILTESRCKNGTERDIK